MIYPQHGHVCTSSESSWLMASVASLKTFIKGRGPLAKPPDAYAVVFRPNSREGETCASAAFCGLSQLVLPFQKYSQ